MDCYKWILYKALYKVWKVHCSGFYAFILIEWLHYFFFYDMTFSNDSNDFNFIFCTDLLQVTEEVFHCLGTPESNNIVVFFPLVDQYLKNDLMRQFDSQVNDFMDSLIEESATLEPAPVSAVFSPPLSDKERNKLRWCHLTNS